MMIIFLAIVLPVAGAINITSEGLIVSDTGYAGGAFTVIEVVKNAGDNDTGPVTISYYLVNESGGTAQKVPIGTADLDSITSGGDYSSVKTFLLPLDLADGAYRFVREIMGKETPSSQEKVIRIADQPKADGSNADLVGSGVIVPGEAGPGDQIRAIAAVENRGGSNAGEFSVDFYLTNRSSQTSEPLLLGTWNVGSIPAKGQASSTRTLSIPTNAIEGNYGILMEVDPDNKIPESDENNNDWYRDDMIKIIAGGSRVILPPVFISTATSIEVVPLNTSLSNQT